MEINLRSMQHRSSMAMTPTTPGTNKPPLLSPLTGTRMNNSPALVHVTGSAVKAPAARTAAIDGSIKSDRKGTVGPCVRGLHMGSRTPGRASEKKKRAHAAPSSAPRLLRGSSKKQRASEKNKTFSQQDENSRKNTGGVPQLQQQSEELTPLKRLFQEALKEGR